jgi:3-oxoacyl-[acyl-carrier-protein] synthase-3
MSDGAGYDSIIIESGGPGSRNPLKEKTAKSNKEIAGTVREPENLSLKGADIFSFAISSVPSSIKRVCEKLKKDISYFDFLVLHQANKMINDQIIRKTMFNAEKALTSLEKYGNTSSASIPLTITANKEILWKKNARILASGFGVGLSWGTVAFDIDEKVFFSHKEYK